MRIKWRGLELPYRLQSDRETLSDTYGRFVAEPFERGFGVTIGNSLRRVLLSSLEGSSVTRVKIQGVQHEITTIPGVVEDVTDIILNIKSLVVKNASDQTQTIRIDRHEQGVVTAAHINTEGSSVQIINPEHIIATMTADVPFVVEMTIENGRGYKTADENAGKEREIGIIPVDSSFSPVVRVKYEIEETRVGQKTNYDKLLLDIWTNGTITPQMALVEGAKILRKHLNPFIQYAEPGPEMVIDDKGETAAAPSVADMELERKLNMSLAELELSVRATNCLESEGITTVRDLVIRNDDELLEVRNFGETTLKEVKQKLQQVGLSLGLKLGSAARR